MVITQTQHSIKILIFRNSASEKSFSGIIPLKLETDYFNLETQG